MTAAGVALIGLLMFFGALGMLFCIYIWEEAQERKKEHNKRVRLVNEAIQRDIAAKSRKHNTMRQMRDVARDYHRP